MNNRRDIRLQAWTLSETLVMLIVAGVVFLAMMDGLTLFIRYSDRKTSQITENIRLYEGYRRLEHIVSSADSAVANDSQIIFYREGSVMAALTEQDSLLLAFVGSMSDTLLSGVSGLQLSESTGIGADSIRLTLKNPYTGGLNLSFSVKIHTDLIAETTLREREKEYAYE